MFVKPLHKFIKETYGIGNLDSVTLSVLNTFALWLQNQGAQANDSKDNPPPDDRLTARIAVVSLVINMILFALVMLPIGK